MEVLYQLSYSPVRDGHDTSAGRAISARYARRACPIRFAPPPRSRRPLQRRARQRDRGEVAGPLGRRPHLLGPQPDGRLSRADSTRVAAPAQALRARHVPVPERHRPPRRPSPRLHRHRRLRPLHAHAPATTCCTRWATTRSGSRPSSTRCRPASTRASPPRRTSPTCGVSCARSGLGHDPRRGIATTDVDYYRWTQWIFLQLYGAWYDDDAGPRPADRRADRRARGRHARTGERRQRRRARAGATSTRPRAARSSTRYRLAYLDDARVNWCPGARHGAGQRGGHRRRPQRARQPSRSSAARSSSGCCASPTYADRLLADLDLLDWPESIKLMQRNWIGRSDGAEVGFPVEGHDGRRHRGVHDAPRHACSAPPTWCSRPSIRWST